MEMAAAAKSGLQPSFLPRVHLTAHFSVAQAQLLLPLFRSQVDLEILSLFFNIDGGHLIRRKARWGNFRQPI
jgi:hypothetical protein